MILCCFEMRLLTEYCISMDQTNARNASFPAAYNAGKHRHPGSALTGSWKPNVLFVMMHLNLLKEQDCSRSCNWEHGAVLPASPSAERSESCGIKDIIASQAVWLHYSPSLLSELAHLDLKPWFFILRVL